MPQRFFTAIIKLVMIVPVLILSLSLSLSLSLKDSLFTVSVNPSGRVIAGISLSGDLSLWDIPSCRLRTKWTTDELVYTQVLYNDHDINCYFIL